MSKTLKYYSFVMRYLKNQVDTIKQKSCYSSKADINKKGLAHNHE